MFVMQSRASLANLQAFWLSDQIRSDHIESVAAICTAISLHCCHMPAS